MPSTPRYIGKISPVFVDTIALLRLVNVSDSSKIPEYVSVRGYYSVGDVTDIPTYSYFSGYSVGHFVDNGGSIIVPTGGNGSSAWTWSETTIKASWFGAKADWNGTTGTDNSSVFSKINTHLVNKPGLLFLLGRYYVKSGWTITASYCVIDGLGYTEIHSDGAVNEQTLLVNGATRVILRNLLCTQPRSLYRGNEFCIALLNCSFCDVLYCKTDGGTAGIWFNHCNNVSAIGNVVDTPKADGIHFSHGSTMFKAIGNTVLAPGDDAFAATYYDSLTGRPSKGEFVNNVVIGGYWGFGVSLYSCDDILVSGNKFSDLALGSVQTTTNGGGAPCSKITIANNTTNASNRVNALPNNYWFGTPDVNITSALQMCSYLLSGDRISMVNNVIDYVTCPVGGATPRTGVLLNGGSFLTVSKNVFNRVDGVGVNGGGASIYFPTIDGNVFDQVMDIMIEFPSTPVLLGGGICNNLCGYGATTAGRNYMIKISGVGAVRFAICNNTSSGSRGLSTDSGTGSTNLLLANNNS